MVNNCARGPFFLLAKAPGLDDLEPDSGTNIRQARPTSTEQIPRPEPEFHWLGYAYSGADARRLALYDLRTRPPLLKTEII